MSVDVNVQSQLQFDARGHKFGSRVAMDVLRSFRIEERVSALLKEVPIETMSAPEQRHIALEREVLSAEMCFACGARVRFERHEDSVHSATPCEHPYGASIEFELNVPSGVMVATDSLQPAFHFLGKYEVSTESGCYSSTKAMARIGCAHGFVGNTCPSIISVDSTHRFIIGVPVQGDESDEYESRLEEAGMKEVASITTDLWRYSIADKAEYNRRRGDDDYAVEEISVKPGVYRFIQYSSMHEIIHHGIRTFAAFEWVREPDSVVDYLAEEKLKQFTAGQVLYERLSAYPSVYGSLENPESVRRAADDIFCTSCAGGDWHENGFVQFNPDMSIETPSVAIPKFDAPHRWYPLSHYSPLCWLAGVGENGKFTGKVPNIRMNPSFLELARNVATCIERHGILPDAGRKGYSKKENKRMKALASECLKGFEKIYGK